MRGFSVVVQVDDLPDPVVREERDVRHASPSIVAEVVLGLVVAAHDTVDHRNTIARRFIRHAPEVLGPRRVRSLAPIPLSLLCTTKRRVLPP